MGKRKCKFKKSKMAAAAILDSPVNYNSVNYWPILMKFWTLMQDIMHKRIITTQIDYYRNSRWPPPPS